MAKTKTSVEDNLAVLFPAPEVVSKDIETDEEKTAREASEAEAARILAAAEALAKRQKQRADRRIGPGFLRMKSGGADKVVPCIATYIDDKGDHLVYFDKGTTGGVGEKKAVQFGSDIDQWHTDLGELTAALSYALSGIGKID
jgi:hypothetical protein